MRSPVLLAGAAVAAWALDVATKSWAVASLHDSPVVLLGGRLTLVESRNPGAAFSTFSGQTVLITVVAAVVVAAVAVHARRVTSRGEAVAWGLLAGGAGGNLTDRLLRAPGPARGHVVDWVDLGWWPSFNLADTAIVGGGVLLVALSLRPRRAPEAAVTAGAGKDSVQATLSGP